MIKNDIIAAVATPPGRGGIAVVRVAGNGAIELVDRLWKGKPLSEAKSHTAHLGNILDPSSGDILDQAVATVFRGPGSYTGDDTVELSVHGSKYVQSELIKLLIDSGARLADPGEYTRRAFAAGHLDLAGAEAVADLIAASSRSSHRIALNQMRGRLSAALADLREQMLKLASLIELELDFSEEDVNFASRDHLRQLTEKVIEVLTRLTNSYSTSHAIKEGIPLAIVGAPNVGKSTLLNTLVEEDKAIVSPIPGTTRDTIEDTIEIAGTTFRIIDTAGLRDNPSDRIEEIGMDRSRAAIRRAFVVVWLIDPLNVEESAMTQKAISDSIAPDAHLIIALNKSDLAGDTSALVEWPDTERPLHTVRITATSDVGIIPLRKRLEEIASEFTTDETLLTNGRHYQAANLALRAMRSVENAFSGTENIPLDLVALDLRDAIHHIGEITGAITTPEILTSIFSNFCIGK